MSQDLISFVTSMSDGDGMRVEETLGGGFVRLRVSEAERRQAKHDIRCVEDAVIEMLRNARDAGAQNIFVASSREKNERTLVVLDDGSGVPESMYERIFDARVTSKLDTMHMDKWGVHGRGMALFSIAQNALVAKVCESGTGRGTALLTVFDVSEINERADQSTWPTVTGSGSSYEVRGPRNIARACVEFACEARGQCNVYLGSPSEIVATMIRRSTMRGATGNLLQGVAGMENAGLVVDRAYNARDPRELREVAASLGMDMSERTAYRIARGDISPVANVRLQVRKAQGAADGSPEALERVLELSPNDKEDLKEALAAAFSVVASRYYVELAGEPRIRMGRGCVRVTFEYGEQE